jgi:hypothetical protein
MDIRRCGLLRVLLEVRDGVTVIIASDLLYRFVASDRNPLPWVPVFLFLRIIPSLTEIITFHMESVNPKIPDFWKILAFWMN